MEMCKYNNMIPAEVKWSLDILTLFMRPVDIFKSCYDAPDKHNGITQKSFFQRIP